MEESSGTNQETSLLQEVQEASGRREGGRLQQNKEPPPQGLH